MAFEILNEADSVVYTPGPPPFNRYPQAEPDKVDFDILAQGVNGEGVVSGAAVTPQGVPDTTVAVAAAVVRIAGTDVAYAGGNVDCGAAAAAFPRFDLIAIDNAGVASAVNGVAAVTPVFPAVPANSVIVAAVWRAANDNTITAADIVDKRCLLLGDALGTAPTLLGIVGGIATPNRSHHTLSAQAGAADDLDGMTVGTVIANGEIVIIRPDAGDTITVKHNALGGADARNILCIGNADIVLDDDHDFAICIYATAIGAGSWMVLGGGGAGGHSIQAAYDGGPTAIVNGTVGDLIIENNALDPAFFTMRLNAVGATDALRLGRVGEVEPTFYFQAAAAELGLGPGGVGGHDIFFARGVAGGFGQWTFRGTALPVLALDSIGEFSAGVGFHITSNVGIDSVPDGGVAPDTKLKISPTTAAVTDWRGITMVPSLTLTGNNRVARGIFGSANVNAPAGSAGHAIRGLEFLANVIPAGVAGITTMVGASARPGIIAIGATANVTDFIGLETLFANLTVIAGAANITNLVGLDIDQAGAFTAGVTVTNCYGIRVSDFLPGAGVITNNRLMEIGPATPYLRLTGGADPAANETNLWLKEGATLRQLKVETQERELFQQGWPVPYFNPQILLIGNFGSWLVDGTENFIWTFHIPDDFQSLVSANIVIIPDASEIIQADFYTSKAAVGEAHTADDDSSLNQTLGVVTLNQITEWDISGIGTLFTTLSAGDYLGIRMNSDMNGIRVIGFRLVYNARKYAYLA